MGSFLQYNFTSNSSLSLTMIQPSPLPGWMVFNSTNRSLTIQAPLNDFTSVKTYNFTVNVTDSLAKKTQYNFTVAITNSAPTFVSNPPTSQNVFVNSYQQLVLPAYSDAEGQTCTYSASYIASFIGFTSSNKTLSFNPISSLECGSYNLSVAVSDGQLNTTKSIAVTVQGNPPYYNPVPIFINQTLNVSINSQLKQNLSGALPVDPDDIANTTAVSVTVSDTSNSITKFTNANITNTDFEVFPTDINMVGLHSMKIDLKTRACQTVFSYLFQVNVTNSEPYWDPDQNPLQAVVVPMNSIINYVIDGTKDNENNTIIMEPWLNVTGVRNPLPAFIKKIDNGNISIYPTQFSQVGIYYIDVEIYDIRPYSTFRTFELTVRNYAPVFYNPLTVLEDVKVKFNNSYQYILPPFYDPEGSPVYIILSSVPQAITGFTSINSGQQSFIIYANQWPQIGFYKVAVNLTDTNNQTQHWFNLQITNSAPYWSQKKPVNQRVRLNEQLEYFLPPYQDDEQNPVQVIQKLPPYATFQNGQYIFKATVPQRDLGIFSIKGSLSDTRLETGFGFNVEVYNDPPYFKQNPKDQKVAVGQTIIYDLPIAEDKEGLPITIKASLRSEPLPSFIKFINTSFTIYPDDYKLSGIYEIQVSITDGYSRPILYNFKVTVIDPLKPIKSETYTENTFNPQNGPTVNFTVSKATIRIVSVGRDARVTLKVISNQRAEDIVKKISNTTFSITVPTLNSNRVPYTIDLRDINSLTFRISLKFQDPKQVSAKAELDQLQMVLNEDIESKKGGIMVYVPHNLILTSPIPPQINQGAAAFAQRFASGTNFISTVAVPGGFVLNFGLSMFIQYLWGLLNDMSFLTIMTMISITVPGIAKLIQVALMNFIYLDMLQTEYWLIPLMFPEETSESKNSQGETDISQSQDSPINLYFDENGFSTKTIIKNLGSSFVYMILLIFSLLILPLLRIFESDDEPLTRYTIFSRWMQKNLIWNFTLRFVIQQYAPIVIASGIGLYGLNFDKLDGEFLSSVFSIVFITTSFIVLYIIIRIIKTNRANGNINSETFENRFGCLTEGYRTQNFVGCYWNIIVMIRWQITNAILLVLKDYQEIQILSLMASSVITQALMLRYQPIKDKNENTISIFIEVMVSMYLYILLTLTDFWGENDFREEGGQSLVVVVCFSVLVNVAKLSYNVTREIKQYLWRKQLELKRANRIRDQEKLYKLLSNPLLFDPSYTPTIEEEQALASQLVLLQQGLIEHQGIIELLKNRGKGYMQGSSGEPLKTNGDRYYIQNWQGINQERNVRELIETQKQSGIKAEIYADNIFEKTTSKKNQIPHKNKQKGSKCKKKKSGGKKVKYHPNLDLLQKYDQQLNPQQNFGQKTGLSSNLSYHFEGDSSYSDLNSNGRGHQGRQNDNIYNNHQNNNNHDEIIKFLKKEQEARDAKVFSQMKKSPYQNNGYMY